MAEFFLKFDYLNFKMLSYMDIFPRINWLYNLGKNLKITFSREFFKKIDKLDKITKF